MRIGADGCTCAPWTRQCIHWNGYRLMLSDERAVRAFGVQHTDMGVDWIVALAREENKRSCGESDCPIPGHDYFLLDKVVVCVSEDAAKRRFWEEAEALRLREG